jgi:hypothetical protein
MFNGRRQPERGEVTVNEAAAALVVSPSTIRRMISDGMLPTQHHCEGAPWIICLHGLKRKEVLTEAERRRSRRPLSHYPIRFPPWVSMATMYCRMRASICDTLMRR